jgi:glycosyltransferase involved in cell wall biosynthesis
MMRLLYLINGLGPGGAERSLAGLLPHYVEHGIEPTIVCLRHRVLGVESRVRDLGCDVRYVSSPGWLGRIRELRELIRSERFDLVHTTIFESDVLGRLAATGTGSPVLTSLVNTSYDHVRLMDPNVSRLGFALTRTIDGWTARHLTTWFHAITEAVKDSAVRHLGIAPERITVVERGRSPDELGRPGRERRLASRDRLDLSDQDEVVVNVARQEYQKGQKHLLEAASALIRERPNLKILVCGREGHATAELRRIHEDLGLAEHVRFLGDREDVADILAAADVFAFPSVYEGLGGAVIEAMALGLPIVCSDIPALREVVQEGQNALLFPPGHHRELAKALASLLDDREKAARFGLRSEQIFADRFTVERSARGMIELYGRVVGMASGGGAVRSIGTAP